MTDKKKVKESNTADIRRSGISLSLSGGGFRAALFHLGAMRRLIELGVLENIDTISSVSGGSIFSAHLATRMVEMKINNPSFFNDWDKDIAEPFRNFVKNDLRTFPLLKNVAWNWFVPDRRVKDLENSYQKYLTSLKIKDLPTGRKFIFCATDLTFGVCWEFQQTKIGSYKAGYIEEASNWPLARAVAASSCFPPIFGPMYIRVNPKSYKKGSYQGNDKMKLLSSIGLSDGGVYDNMALEPVWKSHQYVLISDCGSPFDFKNSNTYFRRLLRYTNIITNQTQALRKRLFFSDINDEKYRGVYWSLKTFREDFVNISGKGYSNTFVNDIISEVRTDLDMFSDTEIAVIENHGYSVTDYVLNKTSPELITNVAAPFKLPHPDFMDESKVRSAMKDSHKRFSLPRLWQSVRKGVRSTFDSC